MGNTKYGASLLRNVLLFNLLVVAMSHPANAQTTGQRTVVLYVNGINTDLPGATSDKNLISNRWLAYATSKGLNTQQIFDLSHNDHLTAQDDIWQAIDQALNLPLGTLAHDTHNYGLLATWSYADVVIKNRVQTATSPDPDLTTLNAKVKCYLLGGTPSTDGHTCSGAGTTWSGTKVVLLGYSQGNFYTNFAYEEAKNLQAQLGVTLPNPNVLEVVGLADPANYSADGRYKYLTVCDDPIRFTPESLPKNFESSSLYCSWPVQFIQNLLQANGAFVSAVLTKSALPVVAAKANDVLGYVGTLAAAPHSLSGNYLQSGSTQSQAAMQLLADSFPDSGCTGDVNCYLKDNFGDSDYTNNFQQIGELMFAQGSTIKEASGVLRMDTQSHFGRPLSIGIVSLRTRRVFTGPFNTSFKYNLIKSGDSFATLSLVKASDNSVALTFKPPTNGWHTLTFLKTDTQVSLSVDGNSQSNNTSSKMDGYYLKFELQSDSFSELQNTLLVDDLSVTLPTMSFTPATTPVSVVQGNSITANLTLTSINGLNGNPTYTQTCPANFTCSYTNGTATLPANGTLPITVILASSRAATPGTYNYFLQATLGGQAKTGTVAVTVTAPPPTVITLTPSPKAITVAQNNFGYADLILKSQNGATGYPALSLTCVQSNCPVGVFTSMVTLPANGSVFVPVTFNPTSSTTAGVYSYNYKATLSGQSVTAQIVLTVTAPTAGTGTIIFTTTSGVSAPCIVNGVALTAPKTLTGQPVGDKSAGCSAPPGYTLISVVPTSQTLYANGTVTFQVNLTPTAPTTGTAVINTTNNVSVSCLLNGVSIIAPKTLTGQAVGAKTLSCITPAGYTITSIAPSASQTLVAGSTTTWMVNLTPIVVTGTAVVSTTNNVATSCTFNGVSITAPVTLTNQLAGVKTLVCPAPAGYTITSITPSASQTLVAGSTTTWMVNLTPIVVCNPTQLLGNSGFESGNTTWTASYGVINTSPSRPAHSGSWKAWLLGIGATTTNTMYQTVTIPACSTSATLSFWIRIDTAETTTTNMYDVFQAQVRNASGGMLSVLATYSNLNANSTYVQKTFNLNAYKGQTIMIYFTAGEDGAKQTSFVLDDITLNTN